MDDLLKRMTINDLKNAIWDCKDGRMPVGGRSLWEYEDELEYRTGDRRGYHEPT